MALISTSKGLNLPFKEKADEKRLLEKRPKRCCIDLSPFTYLHLKPVIEVGRKIRKGEVIAHDVHDKSRVYMSPVSGEFVEIRRGDRRKITGLVIKLEEHEEQKLTPIDINRSKEELLEELFAKGLSFFVRKRPFNRVIQKNAFPRSIFVNTVVSAPYSPSFTNILAENEALFQSGLNLLAKFAPLHLIYNEETFTQFTGCTAHKIRGKHPIESPSIHIKALDPIEKADEIVWTVDVYDVIKIGSIATTGSIFSDTIVALAGSGFSKEERVLIKTTQGAELADIAPNKEALIAGDPLTGSTESSFLREKDTVITSFIKPKRAEILPFIKPGFTKHTLTKTYLWGMLKGKRTFSPAYKLGGEERPFILKDIYQNYLPLPIYLEPLIKALLAKNYNQAIALGFLDIDTNDLALAEYMCPSKIPLMKIFEKAKNDYLLL